MRLSSHNNQAIGTALTYNYAHDRHMDDGVEVIRYGSLRVQRRYFSMCLGAQLEVGRCAGLTLKCTLCRILIVTKYLGRGPEMKWKAAV